MRYNFFIYGSFSEGQVHFPKFSNFIQSQKKAFVKAEAYRLRCGYPSLCLDEQGELVEGTLCEIEVPESFWPIMDELLGFDPARGEKCFIVRQETEVLVDNYGRVQAQIYVLNPKKLTQAHQKIESGLWQLNMQKHPPIVYSLEPRHREYIVKLSKSKGRDIVPIKLDLYRELLSLEMIIDKGRRLALTPLGKEASLFLQ